MIDYSNKKYTDRYLLFESEIAIKQSINVSKDAKARFYACDSIDYETSKSEHNGNVRNHTDTLTIETNAFLEFKENDWLFDVKSSKIWKITKVRVSDEGMQKRLRMRPSKKTYLTLVGRA